jgi:hypothetical protein
MYQFVDEHGTASPNKSPLPTPPVSVPVTPTPLGRLSNGSNSISATPLDGVTPQPGNTNNLGVTFASNVAISTGGNGFMSVPMSGISPGVSPGGSSVMSMSGSNSPSTAGMGRPGSTHSTRSTNQINPTTIFCVQQIQPNSVSLSHAMVQNGIL